MANFVIIKTKNDSADFLLKLAYHLNQRNHNIKFFLIEYEPNPQEQISISELSQKGNLEFVINPDTDALADAINVWSDKVLCF